MPEERQANTADSNSDLAKAVAHLSAAEDDLIRGGANQKSASAELRLFYEQVVDIREQGVLLADRIRREHLRK